MNDKQNTLLIPLFIQSLPPNQIILDRKGKTNMLSKSKPKEIFREKFIHFYTVLDKSLNLLFNMNCITRWKNNLSHICEING